MIVEIIKGKINLKKTTKFHQIQKIGIMLTTILV